MLAGQAPLSAEAVSLAPSVLRLVSFLSEFKSLHLHPEVQQVASRSLTMTTGLLWEETPMFNSEDEEAGLDGNRHEELSVVQDLKMRV